MKILAVSDEESKYLWDYFQKEKIEGIELILSSGDLDPDYLSFLATVSSVPVLYVRGNHDDKYIQKAPEGCICIENKVYVYKGIRILGLGGSMRYNNGINQYTQREMTERVKKMKWKILKNRGIDILLTHSPAYGLNDGKDLPHIGFQAFHSILNQYQPRFFVHGHVHMNYGREYKRNIQYEKTHIINAFERYVFEYELY